MRLAKPLSPGHHYGTSTDRWIHLKLTSPHKSQHGKRQIKPTADQAEEALAHTNFMHRITGPHPLLLFMKATESQLPAGEAAAPEVAEKAVPESPLDSDYPRSERAARCSAVPAQHGGGN